MVAIVDKKKRVLYRVIESHGAEHDSTAFKNSALYEWLMGNWKHLMEKGLYFIGDSAYNLKSFLLTPFDNAFHGATEDYYNVFSTLHLKLVSSVHLEKLISDGVFSGGHFNSA